MARYDWITFLTDYGLGDSYVGVCHGVMARIAPHARVIDVSHAVGRQDVRQGALVLAQAVGYLPDAVHLAVVDPGVGTGRGQVALEAGGQVLVGPDNGLLVWAADALGGSRRAPALAGVQDLPRAGRVRPGGRSSGGRPGPLGARPGAGPGWPGPPAGPDRDRGRRPPARRGRVGRPFRQPAAQLRPRRAGARRPAPGRSRRDPGRRPELRRGGRGDLRHGARRSAGGARGLLPPDRDLAEPGAGGRATAGAHRRPRGPLAVGPLMARTTAARRRCILVTGAARSTGRRLVAALAESDRVARVLAVDNEPLPEGLPDKVEPIQAALDSPALIKALQSAGVDTLVHLGVSAEPQAAGGRAVMKERNVLGTMQLLAAAYHAPDLRRLVLKSTTAVYGSTPSDPAMWTEAMPHDAPRSGFGKDAIQVEDYVRAFDRRRRDVTVTILRLANL